MIVLLALALFAGGIEGLSDDSDGDGLSDFAEVHKYRTDPTNADSDGDGTPDGDWLERREYTYTVRTVVQVLRPVTPQYLTDDYQDVRVLDETQELLELEVLHYPFSTAAESMTSNVDWRETTQSSALAKWLQPGPTSDWDQALRTELRNALKADGIDVDLLDDLSLVQQASQWLLQRAKYDDGFTTFNASFDEDGEPFVPSELAPYVTEGVAPTAEQWAREISARGMFRAKTRGSCTSSSIYLSGCLRALGIPTRTVLFIPVIDAGDPREWELVREGIKQPFVRHSILAGLRGLENAWASHTFNEVWVGERWWRLDYEELGVGILRTKRFGLITHIATFRDWADARMPETIGRRQALGLRNAIFDGANPYSTLSVRDEIGAHSTLELPAAPVLVATVESLRWTDDPNLPTDVQSGIERAGRFGLIARLTNVPNSRTLRELLAVADLRVYLDAADHPSIAIAFDPECWWFRQDHVLIYLPLDSTDRRDLVKAVEYKPRARNDKTEARFDLNPELAILRED